jgi:hypothetical protein
MYAPKKNQILAVEINKYMGPVHYWYDAFPSLCGLFIFYCILLIFYMAL